MTHQGVKLHPFVGFLMHLELCLFTGLVPREWAAVHRKHHQFSDQEGDPHSPYIEGLWKVLFLNAMMYRREIRNPDLLPRYTPNWKQDLLDRIPHAHSIGPILGGALFVLGFAWLGGLGILASMAAGVLTFFVHAGMYIFLNAMINSVCHKIGYRNFDNKATNLQWVAWITAGEGLHNNHHEFPTSASMEAVKGEFDPAWPVIRLLEKLGLAEYNDRALARAA